MAGPGLPWVMYGTALGLCHLNLVLWFLLFSYQDDNERGGLSREVTLMSKALTVKAVTCVLPSAIFREGMSNVISSVVSEAAAFLFAVVPVLHHTVWQSFSFPA